MCKCVFDIKCHTHLFVDIPKINILREHVEFVDVRWSFILVRILENGYTGSWFFVEAVTKLYYFIYVIASGTEEKRCK